MSRLTDEEIRRIVDWQAPIHCYWEELHSISQEILELRVENERLKAKVLLGDDLVEALEKYKSIRSGRDE